VLDAQVPRLRRSSYWRAERESTIRSPFAHISDNSTIFSVVRYNAGMLEKLGAADSAVPMKQRAITLRISLIAMMALSVSSRLENTA